MLEKRKGMGKGPVMGKDCVAEKGKEEGGGRNKNGRQF